jgi:hypothetical protein
MSALGLMTSLNREQRSTFLASFLGWMLDAFDYFLVTFITLRISKDFSVALAAVAFTITLTLIRFYLCITNASHAPNTPRSAPASSPSSQAQGTR